MKIEEIVKKIEKINKLNSELGYEEKQMQLEIKFTKPIKFKTMKELKKELNKTFIENYINSILNSNLNGNKNEWNAIINEEEVSLYIY